MSKPEMKMMMWLVMGLLVLLLLMLLSLTRSPVDWMHEVCLFFVKDCRCMIGPGSCSECMWASLLCISAWQDSSHRRTLCTWLALRVGSFFVSRNGGLSLASRLCAGKGGQI